MSVYLFTALFYFLLFLLMSGTLLCGHVSANLEKQESEVRTTIEFFKEKEIKKTDAKGPTGEELRAEKISVNNYYSPVILPTNKFFVALAGVNRTSKEGKNITVLTKYIVTEDENDLERKLFTPRGSEGGGWKPQFAVYDECKEDCSVDSATVMRGFAAAVKENKIYLFLANISTKAQSVGLCTELNWCFWLVVGDATQEGGGKPIKWGEEENLKLTGNVEQINKNFKKELSKSHLFHSSAFVMGKKKIMFVMKGQLEEGISGGADGNKNVAVVFLYEEGEKQLKLVDVENHKDSYPTFFQWESKIFKILTGNPNQGERNVKEFDVSKKEFENTNHPIVRLHSFLKHKKNFITAAIQIKEVLLFTQQREVEGGGKKNVYLWMTDGTRVSCAGTIFSDGFTETSYVSLLYTNDKLFALHQLCKTESCLQVVGQDNNKIEFTLLKKQLENIIKTLDAWKKINDEIKELYKDIATPTNINFTDGVVGLLSNNAEGNIKWKDDFSNVNAIVTPSKKKDAKKTKKVDHGFTFFGENAGAMWSMNEQSKDQPYDFINTGFTLVATVTVGRGTNDNDNSILGVDITDNIKVGLWCNKKKWVVKNKKNQINIPLAKINCTNDEKYYVALILNNDKKVFIYVNGQQLSELSSEGMKPETLKNIEYFYFGVDGGTQSAASDATITNVLLYNRPFTNEEILSLKPKQDNKGVIQTQTESETSKLPKPERSADSTEPNTLPGTSTTEKEDKQSSSPPPPTTEDSAVRVGVVGVLCFMLFGVFTLLRRYVY